MKIILCIIAILIILIFALSSRAKCIGIETSTVQVKVVGKYYREDYTTVEYNVVLKMPMPEVVPEICRITVEYKGIKYDICDKDAYNKYSDMIGEYVNGILQTKQYDDGTVRYDIIELE